MPYADILAEAHRAFPVSRTPGRTFAAKRERRSNLFGTSFTTCNALTAQKFFLFDHERKNERHPTMTTQKVELYSDIGGLRDLSTYSAGDIANLAPAHREVFTRLQTVQAKHSALIAERADTLKRVAECDRLTDDLIAARNLDYPPITAIEAARAVIEATRPKFRNAARDPQITPREPPPPLHHPVSVGGELAKHSLAIAAGESPADL